MSTRIEWFTATATGIDVVEPQEEVGDGQAPADTDDDTTTHGLLFSNGGGGACITGSLDELRTFLAEALEAVTERQTPTVQSTEPPIATIERVENHHSPIGYSFRVYTEVDMPFAGTTDNDGRRYYPFSTEYSAAAAVVIAQHNAILT